MTDQFRESQPEAESRQEWITAGRLSGDVLGGVVGMVADVHSAVSHRVGQALPPGAQPVNDIQAATAGAIYSLVRHAHRAVPRAVTQVTSLAAGEDLPSISDSTVGRTVLPVVNGFHGDYISAQHAPLAVPMAVRVAGHDLPLRHHEVAEAFPQASPDLVVFVHGLVGDDRNWQFGQDAPGDNYPQRLAADLDITPVLVRYNTGLHISDNGRLLGELIEELVACWPVPVGSIRLVGHSMGGLVCRSACYQGDQRGMRWTGLTTAVVTLGSPHRGAPLEKAVNVVDWLMRRIPEAEPIGRPLAVRSAGVKDLRYGALVEQDWLGHDPDEFLRDRCTEIPFLPQATYYWVAASVTADRNSPIGRLVGDGLVRLPSASGAGHGKAITFDIDNGVHLGGLNHMTLLNHDAVYEQLLNWLRRSTPRPANE